MALWDKLFSRKKDDGSGGFRPIVQKNPPPSSAPHVSHARPVAKPAPMPLPKAVEKVEAAMPIAENDTKSRKRKPEAGTKSRRPTDDESFVKRGLARQAAGDHDGAIEDFTKAIELNPNLAKAYASRGVSREAKGDGGGAKADYSTSIQIEIMGEINRQMRENPDVEV